MTKSRCPVAASAAIGQTSHARPAHKDMPLACDTNGLADKAHKRVARFVRVGIRTRMTDFTRAIRFPGRSAREPDMRSLRTPYRPISIPDPDWRAGE
jgi:hypothetical protein